MNHLSTSCSPHPIRKTSEQPVESDRSPTNSQHTNLRGREEARFLPAGERREGGIFKRKAGRNDKYVDRGEGGGGRWLSVSMLIAEVRSCHEHPRLESEGTSSELPTGRGRSRRPQLSVTSLVSYRTRIISPLNIKQIHRVPHFSCT